jgi:hypothetical protein
MAITNSEQGSITEAEFIKIVILTSGGRVVATRPVVDDEHRDVNVHLRRRMAELAIQSKTTLRLRKHGRQRLLQVTFYLRPPLFVSRQFWFFIAHFDLKTMTFSEPVYLIPSAFLYRHGRRGTRLRKGAIPFQIRASLGADTHDEWSRYRLTLAELGPRIVRILQEVGRDKGLATIGIVPSNLKGAIIVRRRGPVRRSEIRRAA